MAQPQSVCESKAIAYLGGRVVVLAFRFDTATKVKRRLIARVNAARFVPIRTAPGLKPPLTAVHYNDRHEQEGTAMDPTDRLSAANIVAAMVTAGHPLVPAGV